MTEVVIYTTKNERIQLDINLYDTDLNDLNLFTRQIFHSPTELIKENA